VILVDEYQDSNIAQFNMLKLLVGPSSFICVVGDDDQSIYRFRGAEVKNILSFPRRLSRHTDHQAGTELPFDVKHPGIATK
jgi:DNA helicase-2/ATP-dependent DNA helicase PcrA